MNNLIFGTWISKTADGNESLRFIFNEDLTYEYADKNGDKWEVIMTGIFTYINNELVLHNLEHAPQVIGYIGVNDSVLIEGFKRESTGEGIEGNWKLHSVSTLKKPYCSKFVTNYELSLQDGLMNDREENKFLGKSSVNEYTGNYSISENTITITNSESKQPYFENGEKKFLIVDNVLLLLNETTANSYFQKQ